MNKGNKTANYMQVVGDVDNNSETTLTVSVPQSNPEDEAILEEAARKTKEEVMDELLNNETVRQQCIVNAKFIEDRMKKEWATSGQIAKRIGEHHKETDDLLNMLIFFGLAYRKINKGEIMPKYKITINNEIRQKLLREELVEAYDRVAALEAQLLKISNKES